MCIETFNNANNVKAPFYTKIQEKWVDIALILGSIACLTIGVLATEGYFNAIGTLNATYLSYGMYGGALVAFIAEIVKAAVGNCPEKGPDQTGFIASHSSSPHHRLLRSTTPLRIPKEQLNLLSSLKTRCIPEVHSHFEGVMTLLTICSYKNELECYSFYYQISSISEHIISRNNPDLTSEWRILLTQIHRVQLLNEDKRATHQIDCSIEFRRLNRENIQFKVEEINKSSPQYQANLGTISDIYAEAFGYFGRIEPRKNERVFAIRFDEASGGAILGCIFLRYNEDGDEIFVHSLARRASAVRLGITEHFTAYLKGVMQSEVNKKITCDVELGNIVAIQIYQKLGFRFTGKDLNKGTGKMMYNPTVSSDPL